MFLSTNKGVYVNKYTNLGKKSKWILLLEEEIVSVQIYNNILFIGSKSGLTKLNITTIFKKINYQFHLKSIEIEGSILPPKSFETDYTHTNINFNFDLLAYQFSEKKIRYQLIGNTSFSGEVSGMQLQLQNLIPGKYTLTVYPQLNEKNVTKEKLTFFFYIKPAFWQTTTFRLICILLIICLIVFVSWAIFQRKRIKQERKNSIEKQLVEYRLTALKAQINPHFMSNSLVSIQQLVLTEQIDKASLYIAKFGQLIRYLLNYSDQSVSNLKKEISMIELYIELEQLRFENKFNVEMIVDPSLKLENIYIPALITQPLIENAIWHGLLQLKPEQNPQLRLRFELIGDEFIISIEDNGTNRFQHVEKEINENRKSKGTSLIRQRLASLNELYETSGTHIKFIEVMDDLNNKIGTTVQIIFTSKILNKLNPSND
ncbi:MAG: sensor histidine kinase [Fluviicola sp.]